MAWWVIALFNIDYERFNVSVLIIFILKYSELFWYSDTSYSLFDVPTTCKKKVLSLYVFIIQIEAQLAFISKGNHKGKIDSLKNVQLFKVFIDLYLVL